MDNYYKQMLLFKNNYNKENLLTWTIYIDGASRGNPGPSGAGIHIENEKNEVVASKSFFLGKKTNNQAEYLSLIIAINIALSLKKDSNILLNIISDSQLLVRQMNGAYSVKNQIILKIKNEIKKMLSGVKCSFSHVLREKNKKADSLANIGIEKKKALSSELELLIKKIF
jgi:ribonuclease HI